LPLFEALADGVTRELSQLLAPQLSLRIGLAPIAPAQELR
jgi:hypothetical protein